MNLCGYVRVSTDRQAEEGLGLEIQRDAIASWAAANGATIVAWHADEGLSGAADLSARDGLREALECLAAGTSDGIVVYRLDRLARDLMIQEQVLAEVWRLGGTMNSTSAAEASYLTDDPDDPSRKLIRQVLGAVAEYEKSMITLRLKAGRRRKHLDGGYAYGSPPFGYASVQGVLVPVESEQEAIATASELRRSGLTLRAVAEEMNRRGIQSRRAAGWHAESVRRILVRLQAPAQ